MKSLNGRFALAPDATAVAVTDLPAGFRKGLASDPDSVVWTRVRGRSPSIVISGDGNRLLERFRIPAAIPQAVVGLSVAQGLDPEEVLLQGYALLREAVNRGLLLPQREWARARIAPALQPGDQVGRWRIAGPIQVLEDSEVHRVVDGKGRRGALKLARTRPAARLLIREAKVLRRLEGRLAPTLLDQGQSDRRFLVLEWREGQSPDVVAESLRAAGLAARPHLRKLALGILDAYTRLHKQGVVHGDVHPRNILIDSRGRVTLLDFGQGVLDGIAPPPGRAGVASYMEPEAAAALLRKSRSLPASAAGEQYAVSALLYELLTGQQYLDFCHEAVAFLEQVVGEPPRTFNSLGLPSWPEVESVLRRALAKASSDRFPSFAALVRNFRRGSAPRDSAGLRRAASDWLDAELGRLTQTRRPRASDRMTRPQLSVYTGDAGQALALLRVARRRNDPELLSAADACCLWAESRAVVLPRRSGTWLEPGALLQGTAGIALVRAAVGHARSDDKEVAGAVRYFAWLARARRLNPELSAGTAGLLLGASRLLSLSGLGTEERRLLREVQDRSAGRLLQEGRRAGGPVQPLPWANLGMAHGWAGILYALLAWQESRPGRRPPPEVARWLDQLDGRAEAIGRGRRWQWLSSRNRRLVHGGSMTGWCNGSAGFAVLYTAAARVLGRPVDLARAEAAAWDAWTHPPPGPDLCCGATGAAYAMLSLARETGQQRWLTRARSLAEHALTIQEAGTHRTRRPHSLFQGTAGLASLLVDLETPDSATFPLIESLP